MPIIHHFLKREKIKRKSEYLIVFRALVSSELFAVAEIQDEIDANG
jgi:hypothetical protein